jgi:hypothetical protein
MKATLGAALRKLGDALQPPDEPLLPIPPGLSWSDDEKARESRHRAALAILNEETLAAVVVMVREVGDHAEVVIGGEVRAEYWPPIAHTLAALERESRHGG